MKGKENNLFSTLNLIISVISFVVYLTTTLSKIVKDGFDVASRVSVGFIVFYALILIFCVCSWGTGKTRQKVAGKAISMSKKLVKFSRIALSVVNIFSYAGTSVGNITSLLYSLFDIVVTSALLYVDFLSVKKVVSGAMKDRKKSQLSSISELVERGKEIYEPRSQESM